ncbi:polyadenylate-binding protein-interacting protein 6-like [Zingiber officinale]|nr:polyadenylate-binding protein-interacting protein 6-like [Zingiber officinale]
MMQGKSTLNPFATPYVPLTKLPFETRDGSSEKTTAAAGNNETIENSLEHQLPESFSFNYDIQSFQKLSLSGESSSKVGEFNNPTFPDDLGKLDDSIAILDCLSSAFPDISLDYLSELLAINQGDFNDTIDALQQFESDVDALDYPTELAAATDGSSDIGFHST